MTKWSEICLHFVFLAVLANLSNADLIKVKSDFSLHIVHMNDFHARFEQTNNFGGECKSEKCIGGFSRLENTIKNVLKQKPNSVVLNAGDNFQGTLWYTLFKWNVTQAFLNMIPFDAFVLGNHEFDDGISGVIPFIQSLKAPVVVSNINDTLEPSIQGLYGKSVVITRGQKKIGIIGAIVKSANEISNTGNLKFFDESDSVNAEAERLVREEGVFTNIVLSHSGYDVEQEMARKATGKISVIVGGHSHTFLYTGQPSPGPDTPRGPYPTKIIRQYDNKTVLVVQASAYCKYLGNITINYDSYGNVIDFEGKPIFLDHDTPQDEEINELLKPWKKAIDEKGSVVVGSSLVQLSQRNCRFSECTLGNFVTDVMVDSYTSMANENAWTYAAIAITNAGNLRTTIGKGNISYNDMITAQPFQNTFNVGEIQGKFIKEMFEYTMKQSYYYGRIYSDINLVQVSGIHVVLDNRRAPGDKVVSLKVRCNDCIVPVYQDLNPEKYYKVIFPSFLIKGGDGFTMIERNIKNVTIGKIDIDAYVEYLKKKSPVFQEENGRITILSDRFIEVRNLHT